jgi:hypothetical protein
MVSKRGFLSGLADHWGTGCGGDTPEQGAAIVSN